MRIQIHLMLLLGLFWLIYFFIHSALASIWVKEKVGIHLPGLFQHYRIIYNLIAILGVIPLLYLSLSQTIEFEIPFHQPVGLLLTFAGLFFTWKAFRAFDMPAFLGLKAEESSVLVKTGMYAYVRHPLYFATILLIAGLCLMFPSKGMLMVLGISYSYLLIGSKLEEEKLKKQFGQAYVDYAKEVKALIPYVY